MSQPTKRSSYSPETKLYVVLCTVPDKARAKEIAAAMIQERLAACVNIVPGLESVYEWQGEVEYGQEVLLLIKTPPSEYSALQERLLQLHPYDTPEIIAVPVAAGLDAYFDWAHQAVVIA